MLPRPHCFPLLKALVVSSILAALPMSAWADVADGLVVKDPHYGEVLFQFYKQDYFTALTHLEAYRQQQRLNDHLPEAGLLEGGLLLSWGQHDEAGRLFENLLTETTDPAVRNRAWFYLGKVRLQRGYIDAAERALTSINGRMPDELEAERFNLLARVYMEQGRFSDAVTLLSQWDAPTVWAAYARYNLGVALVRMGQLEAGAALLDRVGNSAVGQENRDELLNLRDRANVALGFAYLQAEMQGESKPVLQRVRLNGPYSNKALLGVGWADSNSSEYRKALVPWMELSQREQLDSAVQESLLAVPYAFARLNADPQAAQYYAEALKIFDTEIERLDTALADAGDGRLLNALLASDDPDVAGWYWQLDSLPNDDRSRSLYFTIADPRFHEGLRSYRDLIALNAHLETWNERLGSFDDMLETREQAYAERLPLLNAQRTALDVKTMQDRYKHLEAQTSVAKDSHDVVSVASPEEKSQWERLIAMEENPAWSSPGAAALRDKQRILKGLLQWNMEREFRVRIWRQERNIAELGEQLVNVQQQLNGLDSATALVPATVETFAARIARLQPRIDTLQGKLRVAMEVHENYLHKLVEDELQGQKSRLLAYRAQARFALASIFDRMSARND